VSEGVRWGLDPWIDGDSHVGGGTAGIIVGRDNQCSCADVQDPFAEDAREGDVLVVEVHEGVHPFLDIIHILHQRVWSSSPRARREWLHRLSGEVVLRLRLRQAIDVDKLSALLSVLSSTMSPGPNSA
jgi:hypothetical protein